MVIYTHDLSMQTGSTKSSSLLLEKKFDCFLLFCNICLFLIVCGAGDQTSSLVQDRQPFTNKQNP
jgi:hypothetical protein